MALTSDSNEPSNLLDEDSRLDLEALAEAVELSLAGNLEARESATAASNALVEASKQIPQQVAYQLHDFLKQERSAQSHANDERARDLDRLEGVNRERAEAREETLRGRERLIYLMSACLVFVCAVCVLGWFAFLNPSINEYKAYRASHEQLREGSVFGAQVHEQEGRQYIAFDEAFRLESVECGDLNCFEVAR